jgi:hypothetical protein
MGNRWPSTWPEASRIAFAGDRYVRDACRRRSTMPSEPGFMLGWDANELENGSAAFRFTLARDAASRNCNPGGTRRGLGCARVPDCADLGGRDRDHPMAYLRSIRVSHLWRPIAYVGSAAVHVPHRARSCRAYRHGGAPDRAGEQRLCSVAQFIVIAGKRSRRSESGRKRPGRAAVAIADAILQIDALLALMGLNFRSRFIFFACLCRISRGGRLANELTRTVNSDVGQGAGDPPHIG